MTRELDSTQSIPPFIGRDRELASIKARLSGAERGEGAVALVSGGPGIGKSRLLLEVAREAAGGGWLTLTGRAYDTEGMPPYLPLIEAMQEHLRLTPSVDLSAELGASAAEMALLLPELHRLLPDLSDAPRLDAENQRLRLFESTSDFLLAIARRAEIGLVLCLDDLHWADASTLRMIEHFARKLPGARVLIIGTYRDSELDPGCPLARTIEYFTRERLATRVEVKGLSREEVGEVISGLGGSKAPLAIVEAVYAETEGNPFFVHEVFEYLKEEGRLFDGGGQWRGSLRVAEMDVPQGVRLVIERRLQRLSEECRRVLGIASVLGRTFDYELLRRFADLPEEALISTLEEAELARLVESSMAGEITFAHELIRQTLLSSLTALRRQRLHLKAAEAIESVYGGSLGFRISELAGHYSAAGGAAVKQKLVDTSIQAGEAAVAVYAWQEAVAHYETALRAMEALSSSNETQRCDLLLALQEALIPAGEPLRARDLAEEAFRLADSLGDHERAGRASQNAIDGLFRSSMSTAESSPDFGGWVARRDHHAQPGTKDRVRADLALAQVERSLGNVRAARRLQLQAFNLARTLDDSDLYFAAAGWALAPDLTEPDDLPTMLDLAEEVLARASAPDVHVLAGGVGASPVGNAAQVFMDFGERARAEEAWRLAIEMGARTRDPDLLLMAPVMRGMIATLDGRLEDALGEAQTLREQGWQQGREAGANQRANAIARRPLLFLGRAEEALVAVPDLPASMMAGVFVAMRSLCLAHTGRTRDAAKNLETVLDEYPLRDHDESTTLKLLLVLEVATLLGDKRTVKQVAPRLVVAAQMLLVEGSSSPYNIGRLLGDAYWLLGQTEEARSCFEKALSICEKLGYRPEIALTRLGLADLLLHNYPRERVAAIVLLDFAIPELEAMKMRPALARALRLRGRRRPVVPREPLYPDGLSEREVEVLRLLALGRSNQQISDELVISLNTVGSHVSSILGKTASANRAEAGAYAHRHGLADKTPS